MWSIFKILLENEFLSCTLRDITYISSKIFLIVESFAIKLCSVANINIGARPSNLAKKYFKLCCLAFNIHPPWMKVFDPEIKILIGPLRY